MSPRLKVMFLYGVKVSMLNHDHYFYGFIHRYCLHQYPLLQAQHEAVKEMALATVVHHRGNVGKVENEKTKQCEYNQYCSYSEV